MKTLKVTSITFISCPNAFCMIQKYQKFFSDLIRPLMQQCLDSFAIDIDTYDTSIHLQKRMIID